MSYIVRHRDGANERKPPLERREAVYDELQGDDDEHPSVSLRHESGWWLGAYASGLLVYENIEKVEEPPRHMTRVPRNQVLALWQSLAAADFAAVEREPWCAGYG